VSIPPCARLLAASTALLLVTAPGAAAQAPADLERAIVRRYASLALSMYEEIERQGELFRSRIADFLGSPSPDTLAAARGAWIEARRTYGQSEVLRFYGGPVDDAGARGHGQRVARR
jgi:putative iron-regulated protein